MNFLLLSSFFFADCALVFMDGCFFCHLLLYDFVVFLVCVADATVVVVVALLILGLILIILFLLVFLDGARGVESPLSADGIDTQLLL